MRLIGKLEGRYLRKNTKTNGCKNMKTKVHLLRSDGTYRKIAIDPEHQWSDLVRSHQGSQAFSLVQKPQFLDNKPIFFPTIRDIEVAKAPEPDKKVKNLMMVGEEGNPWAMSVLDPTFRGPVPEAKKKEINDIYQTGFQYARSNASRKDLSDKWQSMGVMLLTGLSVFMVMIMGLIAVTTIYLSGEGAENGDIKPTVTTEVIQP